MERVFLLTERPQLPLLRSLLPELEESSVIVEPVARGTTNAIGLAALELLERDPEATMLWAAADHVVEGEARYREAVRRAAKVARASGALVAIGLRPDHPAPGLGYIEAGEEQRFGGVKALGVRRFVEKPGPARARRYVASGRFFWNLALFCFRCDVFLDELRRLGPRHHAGLLAVAAARRRGDETRAARLYAGLPVAAVDYTVMERTRHLLLVPAAFRWRDVGTWSDLAALGRADREGNVVEGEAVLVDTIDSFVSSAGRLVALVGMEGVVVVDTEDALLVCPKSRAQDVKEVVESLRRSGRSGYL